MLLTLYFVFISDRNLVDFLLDVFRTEDIARND